MTAKAKKIILIGFTISEGRKETYTDRTSPKTNTWQNKRCRKQKLGLLT